MRSSILFTALLLSFLLLISCSNHPSSFNTDEVSTRVYNSGFTVSNETASSIYYFAVEREMIARILWVPQSREENKIETVKYLDFNDILGFEKGKEIAFYYWTEEDPSEDDIQNLIIKTNK